MERNYQRRRTGKLFLSPDDSGTSIHNELKLINPVFMGCRLSLLINFSNYAGGELTAAVRSVEELRIEQNISLGSGSCVYNLSRLSSKDQAQTTIDNVFGRPSDPSKHFLVLLDSQIAGKSDRSSPYVLS